MMRMTAGSNNKSGALNLPEKKYELREQVYSNGKYVGNY